MRSAKVITPARKVSYYNKAELESLKKDLRDVKLELDSDAYFPSSEEWTKVRCLSSDLMKKCILTKALKGEEKLETMDQR